MNFLSKNLKYYVLFAIITFIFYYSSINNEFSLDDQYIFNNIPKEGSPFLEIFSVFAKRFNLADYRPVAMFTFALEQFFQGSLEVKVSHIINLLIYIILCCSIFYVLQRMPIKNALLIAVISTLLFIVHPSHAGVVNNLKSRDGLFSMLFVIWALNSYISFEETKKRFYLFGVGLFFLIGIYSKRDAYNLIFIIPLISFFVYNRTLKRDVLIAFAVLFVVMILSDVIVEWFLPADSKVFSDSFTVTENPLIKEATIWNELGMAVASYFYYLKFMIIPKGYYFYFGYNMIPLRSIFNPITLLQLVVVLLPLVVAFLLYKRHKVFALGILMFYSSLLYCANFVTPVQGIIADRYVFIASLGMFVAFAVLITEVLPFEKVNIFVKQKVWKDSHPAYISIVITVFLLLIYYPFVEKRSKDWRNIKTLFEADMPHLKESFEANRIASTHYTKFGMNTNVSQEREEYFLKALQYAKQANALYDEDIYTQETEGIAYYGLGNISAAETQFLKTIKNFDTSVVSWDLIGDITFKRGNYDSAALCYSNVYQLEKSNEAVYRKYPRALFLAGKRDSAVHFLQTINKQYPDWYIPYESIAYLYMDSHDMYLGLEYMVGALERGLNDRTVYDNAKSYIVQGTKNQDSITSERYRQLLVRLNNVPIP